MGRSSAASDSVSARMLQTRVCGVRGWQPEAVLAVVVVVLILVKCKQHHCEKKINKKLVVEVTYPLRCHVPLLSR